MRQGAPFPVPGGRPDSKTREDCCDSDSQQYKLEKNLIFINYELQKAINLITIIGSSFIQVCITQNGNFLALVVRPSKVKASPHNASEGSIVSRDEREWEHVVGSSGIARQTEHGHKGTRSTCGLS